MVPAGGRSYLQPTKKCVPTWFEGRSYFGPCKRPMRPRMKQSAYVFGISPSDVLSRRIVFAARIAEKLTFDEAYQRCPKLPGPEGPTHVRPARMPADFRFKERLQRQTATIDPRHAASAHVAPLIEPWLIDTRTLNG